MTRVYRWLTTPVAVPRWVRIGVLTASALQCAAWLLQGATWALAHLTR
ncbi:hypothetical protein [Streptomyces sp. NPDC006784]